nr:reverse transcriptase domain-containing protein [Tanacetum cinerariifolium]
MKESKAYKTYLGYATATVPPKVARKFKKASPSKKDSIAIREPLWKLSQKEKKREGTGDKLGFPDVTKDESTKSKSESWGNDEDDSNNEEGSEQENDSEEHESDSDQDIYRSESNSKSNQQDDDDVQDKKADKTKVPVTSFSRSSDLASKFLNFLDIPHADTKIVSPLDVHVHHEVPRIRTYTLLAILVLVIPEASPVYMNIPQSLQTFTSPPLQSIPSPLPTTETTNIPSSIPDFALVFRFNDEVIALEKDVAELKNDPLHTQVTAFVDDYLNTRINQLPQILLEEVSNFAPLVIEKMIQESLNQVNLEKASFQPQSTYEATTTLTEFEVKKILVDKINSSESYLTAPEHQECYDGLIKSYNLDKDFFSSYDVYSFKRSRDDKDKDEGISTGSDQGLKKQKTRKDVEPTTSLKTKDSSSSDYDCEIRYHPRKANVVDDALSRKEREPPLRVRALMMTIGLDLPRQILNAQTEAKNQRTSRRKMLEELATLLWQFADCDHARVP